MYEYTVSEADTSPVDLKAVRSALHLLFHIYYMTVIDHNYVRNANLFSCCE